MSLVLGMLVLASVLPAQAAPNARRCAIVAEGAPTLFEVNTGLLNGTMRGDPDETREWNRSVDAYNHFVGGLLACAPGPNQDYAVGWYRAWSALLRYHGDNPKWRDDLNLSSQLLEKCVVRYHGTPKAAHCESQLQQNSRWLVDWSTGT